jgi:hypothetical protein
MEAWLRGPVAGVPPLLMPVAHMLQHALDDATQALEGLSPDQIWASRGGAASVGYHVRHLAGALDRLFTYARGEALNDAQRGALAREGQAGASAADGPALIAEMQAAIAMGLDQLRRTDEGTLLDPRSVGRKQIPTTVLGLLVHGGEHAARHAGQAVTTARLVRSSVSP